MKTFSIKALIPAATKSSLFSIAFDQYRTRENVFAVVGGQNVIVAKPHRIDGIELIATYVDENSSEELCACAWTCDERTKDPLLVVAGGSGVIKVINTKSDQVVNTLIGHGDEILDLKVSPSHPNIIASASKDHTVRIWTLDQAFAKQPTVAICGGEGGHREPVLTVAFHMDPIYILSGGMDHAVNMWIVPSLFKGSDVSRPITTSDNPDRINYPHVSTTGIHTNYVDCVYFHYDFILSKSANENKIVLWHVLGFDSTRKYNTQGDIIPAPTTHEWRETRSAFGEGVERLLQLDINHCDPWFMKFGVWTTPLDPHMTQMVASTSGPGIGTFVAMGNLVGTVYIWDLSVFENSKDLTKGEVAGKTLTDPFTLMRSHTTMSLPKLKRAFRMMAWSFHGEWLIGVGDSGLLCLWSVGKAEA